MVKMELTEILDLLVLLVIVVNLVKMVFLVCLVLWAKRVHREVQDHQAYPVTKDLQESKEILVCLDLKDREEGQVQLVPSDLLVNLGPEVPEVSKEKQEKLGKLVDLVQLDQEVEMDLKDHRE